MKKENLKNIRIKDIALMAGVSEGTVDRVLHDRGEVSENTRKKVERVLNEIDYSPNLLARSLASKKKYLFTCIIPEHTSNDYWQHVEDGFNLASRDFSHYNVHLKKYFYNQYDAQSFVVLSNKILRDKPDAVILAPIFKEETIKMTRLPGFQHIPFSFIDSKVDELDFLTYYGQNSFQSGYIAAKLITQSIDNNAHILIIRNKRKGATSNQTNTRRNGFIHYFKDTQLSHIKLIDLELLENNEEANFKTLQDVLKNNTRIQGIITFNSKVFRLASYLDELKAHNIQLIGYDLLDKNIDYLKKGVISYLLAQRPEKQAYFTIRDICMSLIMKQEVKKINYMPTDIIIKENIEEYWQFTE